MASLNAAARAVLDGPHLAHLVTMNPDGSPQVSIVWVGLEGEEVVSGHLGTWKKVRNLASDDRVALSIETGRLGENGLGEYLVVHGRARVTEGGAPELLQWLARVYIDPEVTFPPMPNPPPGCVVRIRVDRVLGNGPWTD